MNMIFIKKNLPVIIILIASLVIHFAFLNYPAEVVFDEVWFGRYSSAYFTNEYYFDLHPPLGKLIIAGFAKILGFSGGISFDHIGETFNTNYFLILRFLPALFGSFLPLIIYLLILKMGFSKKTAFLGTFLALFDNAILIQSKFILLDIFLLFFGFSSLYFFLKYKSETRYIKSLIFLTISAILAGLCFSIKWTGLSFLGLIILIFLFNSFKKIYKIYKDKSIFFENFIYFKKFLVSLLIFIFIPLILYYLVFIIHFKILYKSGPGDPYMSAEFQKTLEGNKYQQYEPLMPDWKKFIELNQKMYYYHSTLNATHPYSSKWYQWPIDQKPIWYWSSNKNGRLANIHLFGNPMIWWSILAGIIFSIFAIFVKKIRQKLPFIFWFLLLGYFGNLIPYIFISRVAFLYHYLPSLIFGILILSILYEKIISPFIINNTSKNIEKYFYFGFLSLCLIVFIILSPLNYGFFINQSSLLNQFYIKFISFIS